MIRSAPSLAHRDYRRYFVGQSLSLTGYWIQHTALTWLVYTMSGSNLALGLVMAASSLPVVFMAPLGGHLADRFNRARIMAVTQSLAGLMALTLGLIILSGHARFWYFPVIGFVNGVLTGLEMPSRNAITGDLVPDTILPNATGLNSAQYQVTRAIGPALAGVLLPLIGFGWCFIINAASYLAVVPVLAMMSSPSTGSEQKSQSQFGRLTGANANPPFMDGECDSPLHERYNGISGGFRLISDIPGLPMHVVLLFVVGVLGWSWIVVLPAAATEIYRVSTHGYAALLMSTAIGALIGSLLVSQVVRLGLHRDRTAGLGLVLFAFCLVGLGAVHGLNAAILLAAPAGLGITAYINLTNIRFQTSVPPAFRGRVMGVYATVIGAMIPCGALVSSAISEHLGPSWAFRAGALACGVCGVLILSMKSGARTSPVN
ncbi:MFS transporter [Myxococcota bacterium]|nr:MFS transporter [Myxococcota bacterium]